MSIILFIIILGVIILIHEFGHFIVAKKTGMRVDEFGIGFPPKLFGWKVGETEWSVNLLPFGGFVRIFGENPDQDSMDGPDSSRSFVNKPKWAQAAVLVAGVTFNMILAWALIVSGYMIGLPTPVDSSSANVENARTIVVNVGEDTPAARAGLRVGDEVLFIGAGSDGIQKPSPAEVSTFIEMHGEEELQILYKRGQETGTAFATAEEISGSGKRILGISMDSIGILKLPIHQAIWEGSKTTVNVTQAVAVGLGTFFYDAFTGEADFSQVSGPVGIVGIVGDVSELGLIYLLSFTAFISINLAIINLIPFPALDGGRLLFVLIEKIKGSRIPPKVSNIFNAFGFVLLLILMVVITVNDIAKL